MRPAKLILALALMVIGVAAVVPKEKETYGGTPFQKWSQKLVSQILSNSPWAQQWGTGEAFETMGQRASQTVQGQTEARYSFTARLMSSLALRQAYVRWLELRNNYDEMPPERQQEFDSKVNSLLQADVSQEIVLALSYQSNMPVTQRDLARFFDSATAATLNQSSYLYGPRGRVDLLKYFPANGEATGARFIFPRMVNGQPVLQPGDKEMRFELYVPPLGQVVRVAFDARKMIFQGKLDY
jgi:hypothetical protein